MVCFDKFNDSEHHALALHCGHIIGKSCLQEYEKISKQQPTEAELYRGVRVQFKCPNCKGPIGRNYEPRKIFLTYDESDSPSAGAGSGGGAGGGSGGDSALRLKAQELKEQVMRLNQQCEELKQTAVKAEKSAASEKRALEKAVRDSGQRIQSLVETGEILQARVRELKDAVEKQQSLLDAKNAQLADYEREEVAQEFMAGRLTLQEMKGEAEEQAKARAKQRRKEMGGRYDDHYELSLTVSELTTMLAAVEIRNTELDAALKGMQTARQDKEAQLRKEVHRLKNVELDNIKLIQTNKKLTATIEALQSAKSSAKRRAVEAVGVEGGAGAGPRSSTTGSNASAAGSGREAAVDGAAFTGHNASAAAPASYPRVSIFSVSSAPSESSYAAAGAAVAGRNTPGTGSGMNRSFGLPMFSAHSQARPVSAVSRPAVGIVPSDDEGEEEKEQEGWHERKEEGGAFDGQRAVAGAGASGKSGLGKRARGANALEDSCSAAEDVDMPALRAPARGAGTSTGAAGHKQPKGGYGDMFEKLRAEEKRQSRPLDTFAQAALTRSLLSTAPLPDKQGSNPVFEASKRRRTEEGAAFQTADRDVFDLFANDEDDDGAGLSASASAPAKASHMGEQGQAQGPSAGSSSRVQGVQLAKKSGQLLNSYFRPLTASEANQRAMPSSSTGATKGGASLHVQGMAEDEIEVLD